VETSMSFAISHGKMKKKKKNYFLGSSCFLPSKTGTDTIIYCCFDLVSLAK
jgi:hypothetical protein